MSIMEPVIVKGDNNLSEDMDMDTEEYIIGSVEATQEQFAGNTELPEIAGNTELPEIAGNTELPEIDGNTELPKINGNTKLLKIDGNTEVLEIDGNIELPEIARKIELPEIADETIGNEVTSGSPLQRESQEAPVIDNTTNDNCKQPSIMPTGCKYNKTKFRCPACGRHQGGARLLTIHLSQAHGITPTFECKKCSENFHQLADFAAHMEEHYKDLPGGADRAPKVSLKKATTGTGKRRTASTDKRSQKKSRKGGTKSRKDETKSKLYSRRKRKGDEAESISQSVESAFSPITVDDTPFDDTFEDNVPCSPCGSFSGDFDQEVDPLAIFPLVQNECKHCGQVFANATHLKVHQNSHRLVINANFKCLSCSTFVSSIEEYKQHTCTSLANQSEYARNTKVSSAKVANNIKRYSICFQCNKNFHSVSHIVAHNRKYKEDCHKLFPFRIGMKNAGKLEYSIIQEEKVPTSLKFPAPKVLVTKLEETQLYSELSRSPSGSFILPTMQRISVTPVQIFGNIRLVDPRTILEVEESNDGYDDDLYEPPPAFDLSDDDSDIIFIGDKDSNGANTNHSLSSSSGLLKQSILKRSGQQKSLRSSSKKIRFNEDQNQVQTDFPLEPVQVQVGLLTQVELMQVPGFAEPQIVQVQPTQVSAFHQLRPAQVPSVRPIRPAPATRQAKPVRIRPRPNILSSNRKRGRPRKPKPIGQRPKKRGRPRKIATSFQPTLPILEYNDGTLVFAPRLVPVQPSDPLAHLRPLPEPPERNTTGNTVQNQLRTILPKPTPISITFAQPVINLSNHTPIEPSEAHSTSQSTDKAEIQPTQSQKSTESSTEAVGTQLPGVKEQRRKQILLVPQTPREATDNVNWEILEELWAQKRCQVRAKRAPSKQRQGPPTNECDHCGKKVSTPQELGEHIKSHREKQIHECNICGATFLQRIRWARHKLDHPENTDFICKYCGLPYISEDRLNGHVKRIHDAETRERQETYKVKYSAKRVLCDICGKSVKSCYLPTHKKRHEGKTFQCDKCDEAYYSQLELRYHSYTHLEVSPYKCSFCAYRYCHKLVIKDHMVKCHLGPDGFVEGDTGDAEKSYICDQCGEGFSAGIALTEHLKFHEEPTLKCYYCEEIFCTNYHRQGHINKCKFKKFPCNKCDKIYKTPNDLKYHLRATHSGTFAYVCEVCGKGHHSTGNLNAHMKKHGGGFVCPYCSNRCLTFRALNTHCEEVHSKTLEITAWRRGEYQKV